MADDEPKIDFTAVVRTLSADKFAEVLAASSRKARETYFHRHGVRAPGGGRFSKPGAKNEARTAKLYEALQSESDDEMAEEVLRTWLLTKRVMLAAALDHLGIEHNDGLTESDDLSKFEKLSARDAKSLISKLENVAPVEDVGIYLRFMGAKNVDKALA
ncbi:MAG: hypothetical protein V3T05_14175 [Myxococcota bacterium]